MKLFFAAPLSGLPSDPIALGAHASRLHFAMKLFFAAPARGLPSFETALLSHVAGACAAAEPTANAVSKTASMRRFIFLLPCPELGLLRWSMMLLHLHEIQGNTGVQTWPVNWIGRSPGDRPLS